MSKLYAKRTLLGNIALVVFLAFLTSLTLGLAAPAEAVTEEAWVEDKDGNWQITAATVQTDKDGTQLELTIRIDPLTSGDFSNVWFTIMDLTTGAIYKTVYANDSEVTRTVYGTGYEFVYTWVYAFGDPPVPDKVRLDVYDGTALHSITLTIEVPPPPAPGPGAGAAPAPAPEEEEVGTGTVEVVNGEGTLTVDPALVEGLLADPEVTVVEFAIPAEVAAEGAVVLPADLLAEVFAAGRTAVFAVGGTELEIPPGALDLEAFVGEDVTLKVNITKGEAPAQAFASYQVAGEVYHLEIEVYGADEERKGAIQSFAQPIELTIPYDPAKLDGVSEDLLGMYRFDEATGKWEIVPGSEVDKANQTVSAWRDSLSLYTAMAYTGRFLDMAGHWAEADVQLMAARGVAGGMPDGTFAPDQQVTRAQFAALLIRSLGIGEQAATGGKFTDVAAGAWYAGAVETAAVAGLVGGYPDGTFNSAANITRQELAAMVTRGLAYRDQDTALDEATVERILARFGDAAEISDWARQVTAVATQENIIGGYPDGTFAPQANATRAEAIVMLKRMLAATDGL
jgi:hypothetical protein